MKKFLSIMFLAVAIIFVESQAEAREVFVGSYSDGTSVYLLSETVVIKNHKPLRFNCRVRTGSDYLRYQFYPHNGSPYYRSNDGNSGFVFGGDSPIATTIYRFVRDNY